MSREVMGATPDDDRYQATGTDADVSHDLDAADTDTDTDTDDRVTRDPRGRSAIATRAPAAVTAALGLTAAALGWLTPDLLAATNPPPPVAVATMAESTIVSPDIGGLTLELRIEITNLGPTRVTVTDPRPTPAFAPLSVVPAGTGTTPLRITPDCLDPAGPAAPQVRVTDAAGSAVDVPVTGVRPLLAQTCSLVAAVPPGSGVANIDPSGGSVQLGGDITTDGDRLVLPLATVGSRGALLTSLTLGDLQLTVRAGPVRLSSAPTNVVLEPARSCPADWAYTSPRTDVGLTVVPTRVAAGGTGPGADGTDSGSGDGYVMYLVLPQVTAWMLRTACPGGVP
jgi:hypothetical protein